MVQVSYPGVYVQEIPSGVHTITGVSTSITAFFGQAKEGPINKPVRLLSPGDFEKTFGPPHPDSELATAVSLFFQNGGSDCYVVRLVKDKTGQKASITLFNEAQKPVLQFIAKELGGWGNEIAMEVDYNTPKPEDTFHLRIYRIKSDGTIVATEEFLNCSMDNNNPRFAPDLITQNSKLVDCVLVSDYKTMLSTLGLPAGYSEARKPFSNVAELVKTLVNIINGNATTFSISVDGSSFYNVDLKNTVIDPNASQEAALGSVTDTINAVISPNKIKVTAAKTGTRYLRIESNTDNKKSVVIPLASKNVAATLMLGADQGGIERPIWSTLRPAPSGMFFDMTRLNDLSNQQQNYFNQIIFDSDTSYIIDLSALVTTKATDKWYVDSTINQDGTNNQDGIREKFGIIANAINNAGIGWTATVAGSRLLIKRKAGANNYVGSILTKLNDISQYFDLNTKLYSLGNGFGQFVGNAVVGMEPDAPTPESFTGNPTLHTGFYALDSVDLFNLMVIPKDSNLSQPFYRSLWAPASAYCKSRRAFLIIDPPDNWNALSDVTDQSIGIRDLRKGVVKDYSSVYYPKLVVQENGLLKKVGPGGAMAGIMARTDSTIGVWKAPAGLNADIQGGNLDVSVHLTDNENGVLNKEGVNCLRLFPSGLVCWGGRTMDGADDFGSEWKYIPIRRLALFIEESLYRGTKWVVFEPNDEPLWAQIRLNVGAFMTGLYRQHAFQGSTPHEAFFVKCDAQTTTQADRDLGIVNIKVGFAPLKPAEFVVITIQQMAGQL